MLRRRTVFLALLAPALLTGCNLNLGAEGSGHDFTSKEWKFSARFPDEPKEKTQTAPLPGGGGSIKFTIFISEARDGGCVVGVADMPIPARESDAIVQLRLDGARDGALKNVGGTLKESKEIRLAGKYPGREFTATITQPMQGQVRARIYFVGTRLYQVMVMGTDDYTTSKQADAFLDSFQLLQ